MAEKIRAYWFLNYMLRKRIFQNDELESRGRFHKKFRAIITDELDNSFSDIQLIESTLNQ